MHYVNVRSFDNYIYANIQLGMLQNEGIDCHLKDEMTVTIDPLLSPALGGMKLMVNEGQVDVAVKLLEDIDRNQPD